MLPKLRADLLVRHASELITCKAGPGGARGADLAKLERIDDGAVAILGGRIVEVATTSTIDERWEAEATIDASGSLVSPGFVDAHTHLIFEGSRHLEWERRVTERPAPEFGAGIQGTVARTRAAPLSQLRAQALDDLASCLAHGTTTLESKSGYGLDHDTELQTLRLLQELSSEQAVDIVPTYLGAHVVPPEYIDDRSSYVRLVVEMLDEVVPLARYCDLTCDPVGFTISECREIAQRATELGLGLRFHADQTGHVGGTRLAVELGASSADHLECATDADISALANSTTVGVLLPGVTHHLMHPTPSASPERAAEWQPQMTPAHVRQMVESGCCLALATDYNPGSCPTISMQMVMQLAARLYRLDFAQAWQMATINGAIALDLGDDRGSIEPGKLADLVIWRVPEHGMVVNRFGTNMVKAVIKAGTLAYGDERTASEIARG